MLIDEFNHTINIWIQQLEQYQFDNLCIKPTAESWSLGQVYRHLIDDTFFYIAQIKLCANTNHHVQQQASASAKAMFLANDFPNLAIEGAPNHPAMPQPASKQQLLHEMLQLKEEMNKVALLIPKAKGKTQHPGLGYFNAAEWLQFAEMHLRHHLRQKKRIDEFFANK